MNVEAEQTEPKQTPLKCDCQKAYIPENKLHMPQIAQPFAPGGFISEDLDNENYIA